MGGDDRGHQPTMSNNEDNPSEHAKSKVWFNDAVPDTATISDWAPKTSSGEYSTPDQVEGVCIYGKVAGEPSGKVTSELLMVEAVQGCWVRALDVDGHQYSLYRRSVDWLCWCEEQRVSGSWNPEGEK